MPHHSRQTTEKKQKESTEDVATGRENGPSALARVWKSLTVGMALAVLGYLAYSAFKLAAAVPVPTWLAYLEQTPMLLQYVAADYVRVSIIALASLGLAIFAGYYLSTHPTVGDALLPAIQSFAAFPAPAYFPILFIVTVPFLENALPFLWTEVYIFLLGFLSCFYYVFFDYWVGIHAIPSEFTQLAENHRIRFSAKLRHMILPATFPYLVTGLSSTINSAWAGIAIGEYWPRISPYGPSLVVKNGMMYYISSSMAAGQVGSAAYVALIFAVVVAIYGTVFTRKLMDVATKRYVIEEGILAA